MGDIVKLALRLFVFALVAAVALAMTNEVTKGPIEAQKLAAKMEALGTVLPGCKYEQIAYEGIEEGSILDEIFIGKDACNDLFRRKTKLCICSRQIRSRRRCPCKTSRRLSISHFPRGKRKISIRWNKNSF